MADCARKKVHLRLALASNQILIGQRSSVGMECLPHQRHAQQIVRIVPGLADCDFDLFECLEDRRVVIASKKQVMNLVGQGLLQ